jgi:type III pantothenate kinase
MKMLLVVDVGNSSITTGAFAGDRLLFRSHVATREPFDADRYRHEIRTLMSRGGNEGTIDGAIISSVVPELTDTLTRSVKEMGVRDPLIVAPSLNTGLTYDIERPEDLGSDRIANAVAALDAVGSPAAAVDFGTATTISAVKDSCFLGGAILPGVRLMGEVLHQATAKLPAVDLAAETGGTAPPVAALGQSTTRCIISGMIYGTAGAVERILRGIEAEKGFRFNVVATGGHASSVMRYMERNCLLDPDLTLKGLRLIYERNVT